MGGARGAAVGLEIDWRHEQRDLRRAKEAARTAKSD
jgi:hypothetical protein